MIVFVCWSLWIARAHLKEVFRKAFTAVSGSEILRSSTAPIFIVRLIKVLLLQFGGLESYRRKVPLFLGMAVGYIAGISLGVAVDVIWFNGNGHALTGW